MIGILLRKLHTARRPGTAHAQLWVDKNGRLLLQDGDTGKTKAVDSTGIDNTVAAPTSPTDTGIAGDLRVDSNYLYVCVAADEWLRINIAAW
jgi:hypothetical protein